MSKWWRNILRGLKQRPSGRGRRSAQEVRLDRLRRRAFRVQPYGRVVVCETQSEAATAAAEGATLALVGSGDTYKWLVFRCPCGCGVSRRISLSPKMPPTWRLRLDPGPLVSLFPSVDLRSECRAHFILSQNRAYLL